MIECFTCCPFGPLFAPVFAQYLDCFPTLQMCSGQKMVEWNELDVASFLEQATGFLAEHGQLDGPSCHAPPAKRARSVGVISPPISFSLCLLPLCRPSHKFSIIRPFIETLVSFRADVQMTIIGSTCASFLGVSHLCVTL